MYGLLLESVRFYIKQSYGEKTWESLCRYCELTNSVFSSREIYGDNLMPKLAEACSALLPCGQPTAAYMEYFGKCFVEFTGNYGYSKVLMVYSRNFRDLLDSIDSLHEHLRFGFPKLQSPSFECKEESSSGLTLHYRSRRYGFKNYVIGQVKDLALRYFKLNINVEILKEENLVKHGSKKYHVVYRIIFDNSTFMPIFNERKFLGHKRAVPIDLIFSISPFSFLIDKDLKIFRAAKDLNNYFGENMAGKYLQDVFIVRRPPTDLTWDELIYHERIIFELIAKQACNVSLFTKTDHVKITDMLEEDTELLKRILARKNRSSGLQSKSKKGRSFSVANGAVESLEYASKNKQQFFMSHEECMPINEDKSVDGNRSLPVQEERSADNGDKSADSDQDLIAATAASNASGSFTCPVMKEPPLNTSRRCEESSIPKLNSFNCTNGNARCWRHVVSGESDCLNKNKSHNKCSKYLEDAVDQNSHQNNVENIESAIDTIEKEILRKTSALHSCQNGLDITKCPHIISKTVEERNGILKFDSGSCEILKPLQAKKYTTNTGTDTIPNGNVRHSEEVMAEEQVAASKTVAILRTVKDKLLKSKLIRNINASFQIADVADSKNHVKEEIHLNERMNGENGLKDNKSSNDMVDEGRSLCSEKLKKSLAGEDRSFWDEKLKKSLAGEDRSFWDEKLKKSLAGEDRSFWDEKLKKSLAGEDRSFWDEKLKKSLAGEDRSFCDEKLKKSLAGEDRSFWDEKLKKSLAGGDRSFWDEKLKKSLAGEDRSFCDEKLKKSLAGEDRSFCDEKLKKSLAGEDRSFCDEKLKKSLAGEDRSFWDEKLKKSLAGGDRSFWDEKLKKSLAGEDRSFCDEKLKKSLAGEDRSFCDEKLKKSLAGEDRSFCDEKLKKSLAGEDRSSCDEKLKKSLGEDKSLCKEKLNKSRTCSISQSSESIKKIEPSECKTHFEKETQTEFHSFPGVRKKMASTTEKEKQQQEKQHEHKPWRSKIKKWLQRQQYKPLHLRGQMKHIKEWNMVLFIGTPLIGSVDDLRNSGLYLSDLGMHDGSGLLAMQGTQRLSEIEFAWDREKLKGKLLKESTMKLEDEKRKTEYLLYSMMPREIAERMKNGDRELTTCETFDNVTILFGYIHNFTEICNQVPAMKIVQLISELFSLFDILSENHKVYKFETIGGGVYMLVSGAPVKIDDHAREMAFMAMHMLEEVQTIKNPLTDKPLELQIGIHSGPVVAGVIGQTTLQYCLFGNTVNISSRMQSTGKPMQIHLSTATNRELEASNMMTKYRGQIPVKGVGNLDTYWLIGPKDQNQNNNNALKQSDLHDNNQVNN